MPNTSSNSRTGSVSAGGRSTTIAQDGTACTFSLSPSSVNVGDTSGAGTVGLTASSGSCAWTASSNAYWLKITSATSGTGSATVNCTVAANTYGYGRAGSLTIAGQSFTVNQGSIVPLRFVAMPPCRVVDTRNPAGPFGGPAIAGGGSRDFPIPSSGVCTIPPTAASYSFNITVVPHGSLGYLSIWPTGQPLPTVSTLNSPDGRIKANAAIVGAGTNGAVSVYVTNIADVIMDINGYFLPASSNPTAPTFYPLTPCRVADTRSSSIIRAGQSRDIAVASSGCLPPAVTPVAYSLNITVVPS